MTRRASILVYCLLIALGLLGLQSWSIAVGHVEQRVIAAIEDRTGLVVSGMERAEIALLPLPRISLSHVSFTQREGLLAGSAVRLKARARLLPLLAGRFTFDRIDLIGPQIDVAVSGDDDKLADWLAPPLAYLERLRSQSKIIITAGSVFMRAKGAIRTVLRDVNLFVEDRDASEPLVVTGGLNWRGVPTEVNLRWPMAGERAKMVLTASSSLMYLHFDGMRTGSNEPVVNGQLTLSTPALPELLGWFGERPRLASAIGAFNLSAEAQIKRHEASLNNVIASIDGQRLDGAIKLGDAGGRWSLSGTLAGAALDFGRLSRQLDIPAMDQPGDESPLAFDTWTAQDIDLRVSVDSARANGARLSDVATYLLVKKGRFEAGLLRAGAYGGSAKGRLLAIAAPGGVDVKLQAGLDKVNFGQAAADMPPMARLSGTGGLQLALDGIGTSIEEVLSSFNGRASLALRQGELGGFAFADLLRRLERNPALALRDWRQGRTPFETATVNAAIANGIVTVTDAQMSGPGYRMTLAGQAFLPTRNLDMSILLLPLNGPLTLPFTLRGSFEAPTLEVEADAALSSSGASALPTLLTR